MAGHNIEWPAGDPDLGSHEMRLFVPAAFARGERSCSPPHTTTLRAPVWRRLRTAVLPLAAALLAWVPPASANAQGTGGTVVGRVTDAATGQPIQQARVLVQGTQNGALTTENGRYSLRIPSAGPIVLEVSRIGYEAKKLNVTAGGTAPVVADAALTQAAFSLSAVVTTVTGQQRKVELANATATVNVAEKIAELPVANMGQLLSGVGRCHRRRLANPHSRPSVALALQRPRRDHRRRAYDGDRRQLLDRRRRLGAVASR